MPKSVSRFFYSKIFFAFVLVVGLLGGAIVDYRVIVYLREKKLEEGRAAFEKAYLITRAKLSTYVYGLQGVGGLYLNEKFKIIPRPLRKYAEFTDFFSNFPGVMGFGFIRYIPQRDFAKYQKSVAQAIPGFKVRRLSSEVFADYMVIESIEPIENNRPAQGLDVGSEANRRETALRAMVTGEPALTKTIQLVQVNRPEPGFLFYLPLYKDGVTPISLEEREKKIIGWAYAPILASSIGQYLKESIDARLEFSISEERESLGSLSILGNLRPQDSSYARLLRVGGRNWILAANYKYEMFPGFQWVIPLLAFALFSGIYTSICFFVRDLLVTQVASQRRAEKVEMQLATLINGASFMIIATDKNGVITTFNQAAERMLGYSATEVVNQVTPKVFHDEAEMIARAEVLSKELGRTIEPTFDVFVVKAVQAKVDVNEWTYIRKDGTRFPVRLVVTPIYNQESLLEGYLGVAEDLTEVIQMREVIELQREKMISTAKLSSLGEMAGGIAHEINNPLAIITSKAELLERKIKHNEVDLNKFLHDLSIIDQTADRIAKIVRGLRAFSRESSRDPLVQISLSSVVQDTLNMCIERFKFHQIDVRVDISEDCLIMCHPSQISQVLLNLLGNSFDAISGNAEKWVEIRARVERKKVIVSVTDSGRGISKDVAQKMMNPFFTTKEVGKGTGLGLSISMGLIEAHGGKLYYDARHTNTRFIIELPLA